MSHARVSRTRAISHADVQRSAAGGGTERAVLVCGAESAWRLRWREILQRVPVVVLLASRSAEAAKWLSDPRLVLVVALEDASLRKTVSTLAPLLPTVWLPSGTATDDAPTDADIDLVVRHLALPRRD